MQNTSSPTSAQPLLEVHQLTQAQFVTEASIGRLLGHGRKWKVRHGNFSAFSDADSKQAALVDVHQGAVNNALYLNQPDAPAHPGKPSIPSQEVLADYPELVTLYASVFEPQQAERLSVSKTEFDAVIAGLRMLAAGVEVGSVTAEDGDIGEILTDGGMHSGLSAEEIHDLCDRLLAPTA